MTQPVARAFASRRRAPRYGIEAPVRYWTGDGDAGEGTTVNVGRLGILFRTSSPAPPVAAVVQMRMALSAHHGWAGAYVACVGRVLRAIASSFPGETIVAATIDKAAIRPADSENAPPVGSHYAESEALLHALTDQNEDIEAAQEHGQPPEKGD